MEEDFDFFSQAASYPPFREVRATGPVSRTAVLTAADCGSLGDAVPKPTLKGISAHSKAHRGPAHRQPPEAWWTDLRVSRLSSWPSPGSKC